jgi:hypothetical protein
MVKESDMGKLDAAIGILEHQFYLWVGGRANRDYTSDIGTAQAKIMDENDEAVRSAIRVLEAAGKVDKEAAQTWFAWLPKGVLGYGEKTLRALLESLPD